ncbi:hypothetical protein [Natrinema sp. DC36]|uniref:hypothetical protein n=1 Tax=Natrinema sp. DC36 TaxID=2878680 RepID=UPI001CF0669D|nr:hypothetical protein [Natrinema sp. DC36]
MYKDHGALQEPSDRTRIWRYRPFKRFEQIVEDSQLYFARSDEMDDDYEGAIPGENFSEEYRERRAQQVRESLKRQWENVDLEFVEEQLEEFADEEIDREQIEEIYSEENLESAVEQIRERPIESYEFSKPSHFLNCWHINDAESNLMWDSYSDKKGIAIKSTIGNLKNAFRPHKEQEVFIGKVRYIDFSEDSIPEGNGLLPFVHKRKQYKGEKELRAIIFSVPTTDEPVEDGPDNAHKIKWEQQPNGIPVSVDLQELIESVYVAPGTTDSTIEAVGDLLEENGLNRDLIIQSSIDDSPPERPR